MSEEARSHKKSYLDDMLRAAERVAAYIADTDKSGFLGDTKTQDAVVRNIEIIGEAARGLTRLDPVIAVSHPEIPWAVISAMRNRLAHAYFAVDLEIVWQTTQSDLPKLAQQIRIMMDSFS